MKRRTWTTTTRITLAAVGTVVGVTEIYEATTTFEMTLALMDMGVASIDLTLSAGLETKLESTLAGKLFLDKWNKFILIYSAGRVYVELSALKQDLRNLGDEINDSEVDAFVLKISGYIKKKVKLLNPSQSGSQTGTTVFELLDDVNLSTGQLKRIPQAGGNKFNYYYTDYVGGNGLIINNQLNLNSSFEVVTSNTYSELNIPSHYSNILYGDLNFPKSVNDNISGLGKIIFDDALTYFSRNNNMQGIYGLWKKDAILYADYGGESLNLTRFKAALSTNMSREQAAFETITGKWAKANGFTNVEFIEQAVDNSIVKVIFSN